MRQPPHPEIHQLQLTDVLAALSDPVRLALVRQIACDGECGCGALAAPVAKSTLSHHLKVLREAGITRTRCEGTRYWVTLSPKLEQAFPGLLQAVLAQRSGEA